MGVEGMDGSEENEGNKFAAYIPFKEQIYLK